MATTLDTNRDSRDSPHPWVFAVLYFPYGLTIGFPSIALGFLGRRAGLPTSAIAAIVGMSFLAAGWKFLWAPVGDYTLTRKRWYLLAVVMIGAGLIALTVVPLSPRTVPFLSALVLFTSVSGTFLAFATEGLMVHNSTAANRGRAGGWFQSGNQFGQTAGGGIGLWLMSHVAQPWMAGVVLSAIIACCALALIRLDEPPRHFSDASFASRAGGGVAIVLGCFAGGRLADRIARPDAYAISCAAGLVACIAIALSPRNAIAYAATTLFYTFILGMVASSFTPLVLALVGRGAPATKINLFFAINSLFSIVVLRADGWAHDRWGSAGMLYTETLLGVAALLVFALASQRIRGAVLAEAA